MRFIPFSRLHEERQEEMGTSIELLNRQTDPVQPAGFGAAATGDPAEVVAERDAVRRTMAQLPEAQRLCLLLLVVGGFSSVEIAHMLDLGGAAVRQRLARARKQFQRIYAQESGEAALSRRTPAPEEKGVSSESARHPRGEDGTFEPRESYVIPLASAHTGFP
jgi:RNA polymerase sigma-70 factor, ECF subfamily